MPASASAPTKNSRPESGKGLPKPRNALFVKFDHWDAIVFDLDIQGVTNSHIRAHWLQAGTWIDIHLSITTDKSSDDARSQLEALLKTIAVTEKGPAAASQQAQ